MARLTQTPQRKIYTMSPQETQGWVDEVNTLPKKDFYPVQMNEVGPQHNCVHYRKPSLLDAPFNKQTRHDLERLLDENHDIFVKDERQIDWNHSSHKNVH